jgi:hypothetical protein
MAQQQCDSWRRQRRRRRCSVAASAAASAAAAEVGVLCDGACGGEAAAPAVCSRYAMQHIYLTCRRRLLSSLISVCGDAAAMGREWVSVVPLICVGSARAGRCTSYCSRVARQPRRAAGAAHFAACYCCRAAITPLLLFTHDCHGHCATDLISSYHTHTNTHAQLSSALPRLQSRPRSWRPHVASAAVASVCISRRHKAPLELERHLHLARLSPAVR